MTDRDIMQQALEALTRIWEDGLENYPVWAHEAAMDSLRERLAQPEQDAVLAEREACANIDWTPILRNNGMVTWGDAETLADLVSAAIRARGNT